MTTPADGQDAVLALDLAGKQSWLHRGSARKTAQAPDPRLELQRLARHRRHRHVRLLQERPLRGARASTARSAGNTTSPSASAEERLFWDQGSSPVVTDQHVILARMHGGESWLAGFDKAHRRTALAAGAELPDAHRERQRLHHAGALRTRRQAGLPALGRRPSDRPRRRRRHTPLVVRRIQSRRHGLLAGHRHAGHRRATWRSCPVGRDDRPGPGPRPWHPAWAAQATSPTRIASGSATTWASSSAARPHIKAACTCCGTAATWSAWIRHRQDHLERRVPRAPAPYYSSPVIANGLLYAAREDGVVFVGAGAGPVRAPLREPDGRTHHRVARPGRRPPAPPRRRAPLLRRHPLGPFEDSNEAPPQTDQCLVSFVRPQADGRSAPELRWNIPLTRVRCFIWRATEHVRYCRPKA